MGEKLKGNCSLVIDKIIGSDNVKYIKQNRQVCKVYWTLGRATESKSKILDEAQNRNRKSSWKFWIENRATKSKSKTMQKIWIQKADGKIQNRNRRIELKIELDFLKSMWYNRIVNRNRKFEIENEKGNLKWKINFSNGIQKRNLGFALDAEQNIIGHKIGNHLAGIVCDAMPTGASPTQKIQNQIWTNCKLLKIIKIILDFSPKVWYNI